MPHSGCRKIADCFNRRFESTRQMTVGKSYVSDTIRQHYYEITVLRRQIKNAKPKAVPCNLVWALDLTGKTTHDGKTCLVLAILEHASRAALSLETLHSKSSWTLVAKIIAAIKRYGKPKMLRTDNEPIFTSRILRCALFLLCIRHQKTDLHCPWQNGRVERFFGSLKASLDQLDQLLHELRRRGAVHHIMVEHHRQVEDLARLNVLLPHGGLASSENIQSAYHALGCTNLCGHA